MTLIFSHDDRIYRLEVKPVERVMEGHIGYRNVDRIMLRKDVFDEFIYNLRNDDFENIRKIINALIDFNANDLPYEARNNIAISYQL